MRIAIVGWGYVADFYLNTLPKHPAPELAAVTHRDPERTRRFAAHYGAQVAANLEDPSIDFGTPHILRSTFDPTEPMPWAT